MSGKGMRKKSEWYHKHGKHRSVLMEIRAMQRKPKRIVQWFRSIRELFRGSPQR